MRREDLTDNDYARMDAILQGYVKEVAYSNGWIRSSGIFRFPECEEAFSLQFKDIPKFLKADTSIVQVIYTFRLEKGV